MFPLAKAVVVSNELGIIEMVNQRFTEFFGYQQEEIIGQNIKIIVPENIRMVHDKLIEGLAWNRI